MQIRYYGDKLSKRIAKTPEGFLICQDVPISRTGYQDYLASEIMENPRNGDKIIHVYRPAEEVFNFKSIASFEGKPVTNEHPDEDVTPDNYQQYACGHVQNVHPGEGADKNKVLADLYITDPGLINSILNGKREISCGYYAEEKRDSTGKLCQTKIRGNHVAVVNSGRAGSTVCIRDHKQPLCHYDEDEFDMNHYDYGVKGMKYGGPGKAKPRGKPFGKGNPYRFGQDSDETDDLFDSCDEQGDNMYDEDIMDDDLLDEETYVEDIDDDELMDDEDIEDDDELMADDDLEDDDELMADDDFEDDDEYYPLALTNSDDDDELIEDFGVKGMKKGVRKAVQAVGSGLKKAGNAVLTGAGKIGTPLNKLSNAVGNFAIKHPKLATAGHIITHPIVGTLTAKNTYNNLKKMGASGFKYGDRKLRLEDLFEPGTRGVRSMYDSDEIMDDLTTEDLFEDEDELMDEDIMDDEEMIGDDLTAEDLFEDDDEIVDDDEEVMCDDNEEMIGDDLTAEDLFEDDDEIVDEDIEDDDDELMADDDEEIMADEDIECDDDELMDDDIMADDDEEIMADEDIECDDEVMDEDIEDEDVIDKCHDDDEELMADDDEIMADDDEEMIGDDLSAEDLFEDDDMLDDDDEVVDEDVVDDDEEIMADEDIEDDDDEVMDDDVDVVPTDEVEQKSSEGESTLDTKRDAAIREIMNATREVSDPVQRKKLQDTIYHALCGKSQMKDIMRITQKNARAKHDSIIVKKNKISMANQQAIYDSFNPHKQK